MEIKNIQKITLAGLVSIALLSTGCATKKYVQEEMTRVDTRVDGVESQVESNQQKLENHDQKLDELSKSTQEALTRAEEAGKLAEGKLLYETVLTDANSTFASSKSDLSDDAKGALDEFASKLKGDNADVFVEIQGHTDSLGAEDYNHELGLSRAEAVRRYLNMTHQIPLHRMSVISYGESAPLVENDSRENRSQNRRVVLVVLK